ncbi:MAG: hypothetical protein WD004_08320, partial [Actinomycetota bacterium]
MESNQAIRVIAVDGTPPAIRNLRPLLRADGFDLCGQASTATGLRDLVDHVHPDVVVFGTEAPVETVVAARGLAPEAGIVVVWPKDVAAFDADERVEPVRATSELGTAVRAAYHRNELRAAPPIQATAPTKRTVGPLEPIQREALRPARRSGARFQPLLGAASFLFFFLMTLALFPVLRATQFPFAPVLTVPAFDEPSVRALPGGQPIGISEPDPSSDTSVAVASADPPSQPSAPTEADQPPTRSTSTETPSSGGDGGGSGGNGSGGGTGGGGDPRPSRPGTPNGGGSHGNSGGSHGNSGGSHGNSGGSHGN